MHSVDGAHYIDVLLSLIPAAPIEQQWCLCGSVDNSLEVAEEDEPDGELYMLYETHETEEELLFEELPELYMLKEGLWSCDENVPEDG